MTDNSNIQRFEFEWQGIGINLDYQHDWLGQYKNHGLHHISHIEIRSADKQPLPITDTGYLSHFFEPREIDPVAEIMEWLDLRAQSKEWKKYIEDSHQMSLF